jgi:hypothetical protein
MIRKLQAWWNSLPHLWQAGILCFAGAAWGVLKHNLFDAQQACLTGVCLKSYAVAAAHAGILAVVALYIPSSLGKKQ